MHLPKMWDPQLKIYPLVPPMEKQPPQVVIHQTQEKIEADDKSNAGAESEAGSSAVTKSKDEDAHV
jgi:hypothetical protein